MQHSLNQRHRIGNNFVLDSTVIFTVYALSLGNFTQKSTSIITGIQLVRLGCITGKPA
jgi:hypothetical protein